MPPRSGSPKLSVPGDGAVTAKISRSGPGRPGADGGITGPNGDLYLYAHTQIDAQANYRFSRRLSLVVALLNLNNEVFGFYQGSTQYPIQREFYKPTVSVGVRMTR